MFNPIFSRPYNFVPATPENELGEKDQQQSFEDIVDETSIFDTASISDFDVKIIADKISTKLVKLIEQQLQEPLKA